MTDRSPFVERADVPKAPFYVTYIDSFMSGWGEAKGKDNRVILPCASEEEARIVLNNVQNRTDGKSAEMRTDLPSPNGREVWSLLTKHKSPRFYQPGAFASDAAEKRRRGD